MDQDRMAAIRKHVYDGFLEHGTPPVVEELMLRFELRREEATEALEALQAARHLALLPGTHRILMAWPFSALATPYRVRLRGRDYFANCSWDAIAFHVMLREDVEVSSFCQHCAATIRLELRDGRAASATPSGAIVHFALPAARWFDDIVLTCANTMVFFASPEHAADSDLAGDGSGASLDPGTVLALSEPVYAGRMSLGYARPSRDVLLGHFRSLGLAGEWWSL